MSDEVAQVIPHVELIEDALVQEGVRTVYAGPDTREGAAALAAVALEANPLAMTVRKLAERHHFAMIELAKKAVEIRGNIVLEDGYPDWFGTSVAYKRTISPLIDAMVTNHENRAAFANRLQKAVAKQIPLAVLNRVLFQLDITLEEAEKYRLLDLGPEATKKTDPQTQSIVEKVNQHYRYKEPNPNRLLTPFDPKLGT